MRHSFQGLQREVGMTCEATGIQVPRSRCGYLPGREYSDERVALIGRILPSGNILIAKLRLADYVPAR